MPRIKIYGDRLDVGAVGSRQVRGNPASKAASPPIQVGSHCRNGKHPSAQFMNKLNEATNQAALYRTRELARFTGRIAGTGVLSSFGAGDRARWRFAFRTSPYAHALMVVAVLHPQDTGTAENSYARLDIFDDIAESSVVASETFYYGGGPRGTTAAYGWQYLKPVSKHIAGLDPDTDYYATFYDVDWGRLQSATIFELHSMTENYAGYLSQGITAETEIYDSYREKVAVMQKNLWKSSGSVLFTWSVDNGTTPQTTTSDTPVNLIDTSVSTVSNASPGFTLDLRNKARAMQSGIPVTLKVFVSVGSGTGLGRLYLKDSTGATVLSQTDGFTPGATEWVTITGTLPATVDKYDLQMDDHAGSGITVYAATLAEHES